MSTARRRYCAKLDLPVPRVEDFLDSGDVKLFHLMVVALLEHGEPMELEALARRLATAGVRAATGDMAYSLQKAWHGLAPVYRGQDGRFGLEAPSAELERLLRRLDLRPATAKPVNAPPEPEPVSDDVPLTEGEVRAAFLDSSLASLSMLRRVAAVLDARGEVMTVASVEQYLTELSSYPQHLGQTDTRRWTRAYVELSPDGHLRLDRESPDLPAMRRAVRKMARPRLVQEASSRYWAQVRQERQAALTTRLEQDQRMAAGLRRAVVRVVPETGPPAAAALLDVRDRTLRTLVGDELAELPGVLEGFDLIAALWVRDMLQSLDIPDADRWRLVDLKPPQKTRRLNRRGRTLSITPKLLITSTTGISRPLGDPAKLKGYITSGETTKLRRRLESDVKSLHAFYQYGVLHECIRLRWGFLDETLPVDWAEPGDVSAYEILTSCQASGTPVDLVTGSAPGWSDPWSRAVRVTIVGFDYGSIWVERDGEQWHVSRDEIQAIRPVHSQQECQSAP